MSKTERSTDRPGGPSGDGRNNPYRVGRPVIGEGGFYGRARILSWVERQLGNSPNISLVLYGQPRIGKTSILLRLQRHLPRASYLPVYFNLMDQATCPLGDLLSALAGDIARSAGFPLPPMRSDVDGGEWFQHRFLPELFRRLGDARRVVLLLDEFDVLDYPEQRDLPADAAARAFFPYVRRVMEAEPRLAFVFVVGRQASDLSKGFKATFRASLAKEVWVLSEPDTRQLILEAERQGSLRFTEEAIERIYGLTSGHPYFTQLLCFSLWEALHLEPSTAIPIADVTDVENAVPLALKRGEHGLEWIWCGLTPAERICASATAEAAQEGQSATIEAIERMLTERGVRLKSRPMQTALELLIRRRVLLDEKGQVYRFAIELFRRWLERSKPLVDVKDESDRIDPEADMQYSEGKALFDSSIWQGAIVKFRQALDRNRDHLGAQSLLAQALLETGNLVAATEAAERAYQLDPNSAQDSLIRVWKTRAEELGSIYGIKEEEFTQAVAIYRRLAELQPEEARWRDGLAQVENEAILVNRFVVGVGALKERRWTEAQRAFADVVYLRPTYRRDEAAARLLEAVRGKPDGQNDGERPAARTGRELAYNLNAEQYGMAHEYSTAQCTIRPDGSCVYRREIELRAYSVLTELNYYTRLPEKPHKSEVDYAGARSLDAGRKIEPVLIRDTASDVEVSNRIIPPLLPGQTLRYEGEEKIEALYLVPGVEAGPRKLPFDYFARDVNCPTRKLTIEVIFPARIEPKDPRVHGWYAVGTSMVPHASEEQRIRKALRKRQLGEQYVLTLDVDLPVLGLTYVIAWDPGRLVKHRK